MSFQTSIGTQSISKKLEEGTSPAPQYRILAYGSEPDSVKLAAGPGKLIGISQRNGSFAGPLGTFENGTQPGMRIDVITEGIAVCEMTQSGAAPSYGDSVTADAEGRAAKAAPGQQAIGYCDDSALEGRVKIHIHTAQ